MLYMPTKPRPGPKPKAASSGTGGRVRDRRGRRQRRSARRAAELRRYPKIPKPNGKICLGGGKWLLRFTVLATVRPQQRESRQPGQEVELDLLVEYNPDGPQPMGRRNPLYVQTVDGQHRVEMTGYGIKNLTSDARRVFRGVDPRERHFPCFVTPWREFPGAKPAERRKRR